MAEGLLKKYLSEKNISDIKVQSCGIVAFSGMTPTKETIKVMQKEGVDVSSHKSSALNKDLINNSSLILTMESIHKNEVLRLTPEAKDKVYLLKEFVRGQDVGQDKSENEKNNFSIPDPIGKPLEVYERIFSDIKDAVAKLVGKLS